MPGSGSYRNTSRSGSPVRQIAQQHRVHQTEYCRCCAYAQGQRHNREPGEARSSAQQPQTVTNVRQKRVQQVHSTRFPARFFGLPDAAEFQPGLPLRLAALHAAAHQVIGIPLHVETQFLIHLALHDPPLQRGLQPGTKAFHQHQNPSGEARRTAATAHVILFQTFGICRWSAEIWFMRNTSISPSLS